MANSHYRLPGMEYAKLLETERELHDILPEMDKAEECGIECQEYRRLHREAMERIEKIKINFGPDSK